MVWQIALVLNVIFSTVRSSIDKKLVGRVDPLVVFLYSSFWSGLFFYIFYWLRHNTLPVVYPEMILLGLLYILVIGSWLAAIKINLSQSVVYSSYYLVISMLLCAVFLGEWQLFDPSSRLGLKNIAGVCLALISLYLLLRRNSPKAMKMEKLWLYLILFNIVFNGIGTYWSKSFLTMHGPLESLTSQTIGAVPVLLFINLLRRKNVGITLTNHFFAFSSGFLSVFSATFFYQAIKGGPATVVLPVQTLVLTVTLTLVGLILYKESEVVKREKMLGLVLGIVGVGLLVI